MNTIAIFVDGTLNSGDSHHATNVALLSEWTQSTSSQKRTYIDGVGFAEGGLRRLFSGGTGYGTRARIIEAYLTLCEGHRWGRIFLIGFSRGAFAVRSLMGFADAVGIRLEPHLDHVCAAYDRYVRGGLNPDDAELQRYVGKVSHDNRRPTDETGTQLPIWFVGVWDTVGMLGVPGLTSRWTKGHNVELPRNISHARHALAIHELRRYYPLRLWHGVHPQAMHDQTLEQVWFPGAHADVGGGYERRRSAVARLSDAPLEWIATEAKRWGLDLSPHWQNDLRGRIGAARLHSQTSGVRARLLGAPRTDLLRWEGLTAPTRESLKVHEGYVNDFVKGSRPACEYGVLTQQCLEQAACAAFRMHVGLQYQQKAPNDAGRPPSWFNHVTIADVNQCRQHVEAYLTRSDGALVMDRPMFQRALYLWIVAQPLDSVACIVTLIRQLGESLASEYAQLPYSAANDEQSRRLDSYPQWSAHVDNIRATIRDVAPELPPSHNGLATRLDNDIKSAFAVFLKVGQEVLLKPTSAMPRIRFKKIKHAEDS